MGSWKIPRKRKRAFSQEPNSLAHITFATNFIKHLLTALAKIKHHKISSNGNLENLQKMVKYEVEMAMALSATEFAWGHAMREKLQTGPSNNSTASEDGGSFSLQTAKFSREHCRKQKRKRREREEKKMERGMKNLRRVLPGGGHGVMEMEDLLKETADYIKCLQLQVNVLRCLVDINTN